MRALAKLVAINSPDLVPGTVGVLESSWVVTSGFISPLKWVILIVSLLITLLIATPKP